MIISPFNSLFLDRILSDLLNGLLSLEMYVLSLFRQRLGGPILRTHLLKWNFLCCCCFFRERIFRRVPVKFYLKIPTLCYITSKSYFMSNKRICGIRLYFLELFNFQTSSNSCKYLVLCYRQGRISRYIEINYRVRNSRNPKVYLNLFRRN